VVDRLRHCRPFGDEFESNIDMPQLVPIHLRQEHRGAVRNLMKTRDSGMPDEERWSTFFDPVAILRSLGLDRIEGPVVDVGSGYGTFAFPIARLTTQPVQAVDIEPMLLAELERRAAEEGLTHLKSVRHDFTAGGLGVPANSADVVLLFNILHCEKPLDLLRAAHDSLRPAGRVGIIHWRSDVSTPRGPDLAIRPKPEACQRWLMYTGFTVERAPMMLPPYHFGLVGAKPKK
jgi:SAM-dependent methyltransferase